VREAVPRDDERPGDVVDVVPVGGGSPGDLDAEFTAFMAEHADTLLHTAWLLVGNMDRAEELTQQALVRTYGAWRRARTDPLPYARRVLVNLRVDTWRRHRREVLTDEVPEAGYEARGHGRAEDRDQLTRALAMLTPRQRRVIVLRYLADVSEADVAADLGVTPGTIKTTASRGLATLRAALRASDESTGGAR
jgi:RNA polymerase sigma-70 factor (sigma-E family)